MAKKYIPQPISSIDTYNDEITRKSKRKENYSLENHINELFQTFTADAVVKLFKLLDSPDTPIGAKVRMLELITERSLGKVTQGINIQGKIDHNINHGIILLPAEDTTEVIKLDDKGMPIMLQERRREIETASLEGNTEEIIDAEYEDSGDTKNPAESLPDPLEAK